MPAVTHKGWIYVGGGFTAGTNAERYSSDFDVWESIASLPSEVNHAGTAIHDDHVVICGGYSGDAMTAFDRMLAWDAQTDVWNEIGTLPEPIGAFGMCSLNGTLYLAGGATGHLGGEPTDRVWMLPAGASNWTACPPLTIAREHLTMVATDTHLIAIGGRAAGTEEDVIGRTVEAWDTIASAWTRHPDLPHPRSGLAGVSDTNWVVVAGGETSTSLFDSVDLFTQDRWSALPALPVPVHGMGLASVGNTIYAIGGSKVAGQVASVADVYRIDIALIPG